MLGWSYAGAQEPARVALVIGNQNYDPSVGILKNPHNDIALVGEALANQGFEVLPPIKDARRGTMLGGVRELVRRLNAAGAGAIGLIYYSGHGAAEKDTNINYLIPIDAKEPGTATFWDDSLKLDDILRLLDGARSAAKFIIFDACRNELQLPTKDTSKGLVPVAEQLGMFIAYASAPGRTASDWGQHGGPYAAALARELGKPGLDHLNLFQNVKEAVLASTGGAQQPWESNGLGRRIYLTGRPATSGVRGWLGINVSSVDAQYAARLSLRNPRGAVIVQLSPGGPAALAGLKVDDVVVSINGADIGDARAFATAVAAFAPDVNLHIKIWRNGIEQVVSATLGVPPSNPGHK
jgi:hypothetical protein